jgi:predicted aconitase with swiveling domain
MHRSRHLGPLERRLQLSDASFSLVGRKVVGGRSEGEALVTTQAIAGWGGIDPLTGTVIEKEHELYGVSFADKVLVFPGAKGSSSWSAFFHVTRLAKASPRALVFCRITTRVALGAVVLRIPSVTAFAEDPLTMVKTGDWIVVDGDLGRVTVFPAEARRLAGG